MPNIIEILLPWIIIAAVFYVATILWAKNTDKKFIEKRNSVHFKMTKDQIINIMGPGYLRSFVNEKTEVLTWININKDVKRELIVSFNGDTVVSIKMSDN